MSRLMLFAKRPRLGRVKTRLCPPLDPAGALSLYRAFLSDRLAQMRRGGSWRGEVWWDGRATGEQLAGLDLSGLARHVQEGDDLGLRLEHAFGSGAAPCVAIGADSPTLAAEAIEETFDALRSGREVVLRPALDGGYVAIGLGRPMPALFRDIPWSSSDVCRATVERARELGVEPEILDPGYDVDDAGGLRRLQEDLADARIAQRCPATARALRLLF